MLSCMYSMCKRMIITQNLGGGIYSKIWVFAGCTGHFLGFVVLWLICKFIETKSFSFSYVPRWRRLHFRTLWILHRSLLWMHCVNARGWLGYGKSSELHSRTRFLATDWCLRCASDLRATVTAVFSWPRMSLVTSLPIFGLDFWIYNL